MKVEVAVLGSPFPNKPTVSVDVKHHSTNQPTTRSSELRSYVEVEMGLLGSPSLIVLMLSVSLWSLWT